MKEVYKLSLPRVTYKVSLTWPTCIRHNRLEDAYDPISSAKFVLFYLACAFFFYDN